MQVGTHLPVHLMQQNTSAVAPCAPSIECYPQYAVPAAAVVSIYVPDVMTKTIGLCSGCFRRLLRPDCYLLPEAWGAASLSERVHHLQSLRKGCVGHAGSA